MTNLSIKNLKTTLIPSVATKEASKSEIISFFDLMEIIKTENEVVKEARKVVNSNENEYKRLKKNLPVFLPYELKDKSESGAFTNENRRWEKISLVLFDVDHIDEDTCNFLKDNLSEVEGIAAVFKTPSGQGLRIITVVEGLNATNYGIFYQKAMQYLKGRYGIICDTACGNPGRKSFITYDPNPYINFDCGLFNNFIVGLQLEVKGRKQKITKSERESKGLNKLVYLQKANQFKYADTVEEASKFVEFVLKDVDFKNSDGSGRHTTLFYHIVLTGLKLGIPQRILERGIWEGFNNFAGGGINSWLRGKNIGDMINLCHSNYCGDVISIDESSKGFEFEPNHYLKFDKYITETQSADKANELTEIINSAAKTLLIAPTGAGKSTFIAKKCLDELIKANDDSIDGEDENCGHVIIFQPNVFPTKRAYHELKADTRIPEYIRDQIVLVTGDHKLEANTASLNRPCFILAVIDQYEHVINELIIHSNVKYLKNDYSELLPKLFNHVVIDEIHKIEGDSSFRDAMVNVSNLFLPKVKLTMITATPTLGLLKLCKDANYTVCKIETASKQKTKINLIYKYTFKHLEDTIESAVKEGRKVLARIGLKEDIKHLKKNLEKKGYKVLAVTADNKKNKEIEKFIQTGITEAEIVLCTKILEDGFSIMVPGNFCIIYNTNQLELPDERAIKQLAARCRLADEIDLQIFLCPAVLPTQKIRDSKRQIIKSVQDYIATIKPFLRAGVGIQMDNHFEIKTVCKLFEIGAARQDEINVPKILNNISQAALCFDHINNLFEANLRKIFDCEINKVGGEITESEKNEFNNYKILRSEIAQNDLLEAAKNLSNEHVFSLCYRANKTKLRLKGIRLSDERFSKMKAVDALSELKELGYGEDFCDKPEIKNLIGNYLKIFDNTKSHADKIILIHNLLHKRKVNDFQECLTYVLHMEKKLVFNNRYKKEDFKLDLSIYRDIEDYVKENNGVFRIQEYYDSVKENDNFKAVDIKHVQDVKKFFGRLFYAEMVRTRAKSEKVTIYTNCIEKPPKNLLSDYGLTEELINELLNYKEDLETHEFLERECKNICGQKIFNVDTLDLEEAKKTLSFKTI